MEQLRPRRRGVPGAAENMDELRPRRRGVPCCSAPRRTNSTVRLRAGCSLLVGHGSAPSTSPGVCSVDQAAAWTTASPRSRSLPEEAPGPASTCAGWLARFTTVRGRSTNA